MSLLSDILLIFYFITQYIHIKQTFDIILMSSSSNSQLINK